MPLDFSNQPGWLILGIVSLVGLIFLLIIAGQLLRPPRLCHNCRRKQIPGKTTCPFCGASYDARSPQLASPPPAQTATPAPSIGANPNIPQPQPPGKGARLMLDQEHSPRREFVLDASLQLIGRSKDNAIVIEGLMVSRHHAQIERQEADYILVDLDSTNGSYVNDQRIVRHTLEPGDQIQIGEVLLTFQTDMPSSAIRPHLTPAVGALPIAPLVPASAPYDLKTYRITSTIGSGGSATVYRGISLFDQSTVAIKILHETDPFIREKFAQEGEIGKNLRHPHITRVFHHAEADGVCYIVMEYIEGGSLRQRLVHGKTVPLEFWQAVIGQTCEALAYAHSRHIIHRDIKPENILLSPKEGVKLVDFGIAKLTTASTKTSTGIRIGTPYYMSYEQAAGLPVTSASDLYSLGVILYEMLTGQWPFQGQPLDVIQKHINERPAPPRQHNPSLTPELEAVILRTLEKKANRRYQNAMDLARAVGYQPGMQVPLLPSFAPISEAPVAVPSPRQWRPRLVVGSGRNRGRVIELLDTRIVLGRNDTDSNDQEISRRHFEITQSEGQVWIQDGGSINGTFVNGLRISTRTRLHPGDTIQIGRTALRFEV